MTPFQSINPYSELNFASFSFLDQTELNKLLPKIKIAQNEWRNKAISDRISFLHPLSELLIENAPMLAEIASLEMGKIYIHAKAEIIKSATLCNYYAKNTERLLNPTIETIESGSQIELRYQALGIILGIFPWNFPYWQILRSAIPTIVSGNAMLIKPAPNVPQSSLALQKILDQSGLAPYLFNTVFIDENQVTKLIENDAIAAITLTGSEKTGKIVASMAAANIKPAVLELGGSDPLIILEDAPLDDIMEQVVFSRFQNNGQSCVAAKRFLVQENILPAFKDLLLQKMREFKMGNPMLDEVNIGPLARKDLKELLENQVNETIEAGATLLYQAGEIPKTGYFYPPTVLTNIPKNSRAYQEELFGPVLSLYSFKTIEEAINLANDTRFGLGASIFTANTELALQMANNIETGMVYINQIVKSDVSIPFGGTKYSGFGRELGPDGLYAFCHRKAIWKAS
jgi:succinate-semialdehyde dehydrogenase/glutarate-semialdehyde dehydrogenase